MSKKLLKVWIFHQILVRNNHLQNCYCEPIKCGKSDQKAITNAWIYMYFVWIFFLIGKNCAKMRYNTTHLLFEKKNWGRVQKGECKKAGAWSWQVSLLKEQQ